MSLSPPIPRPTVKRRAWLASLKVGDVVAKWRVPRWCILHTEGAWTEAIVGGNEPKNGVYIRYKLLTAVIYPLDDIHRAKIAADSARACLIGRLDYVPDECILEMLSKLQKESI